MSRTPKLYTTQEFADLLRVSRTTVYQAIRCGRIQAFRVGLGPKAVFRIPEKEIERMQAFDAAKLVDKIVEKKIEKLRRMRRIGE